MRDIDGYDFDYYTVGKSNRGENVNPAVDSVMHGPQWAHLLLGATRQARILYTERAGRHSRTGRMVASASTGIGRLDTLGATTGRLAGVLRVGVPYAGAVEFGQVNLAKDNPRPPSRRRVLPGAYPARYLGSNILGGDNRRMRSVVADVERRYNL
ncbi:hypothetical protein OG563_26445 [Nocardia vinacea]|uniref:HK97 gp10 family phage protein n=1 Tax=Nocardia vinacea TaxID=96468 RepID=A0ABZ1YLI5_9NOCA|nr:hypothetical protein [Nocardia vinacea]